ncbi:PAS domain-containing protein [Halosimplex aquaticum]
MTEALKDRSMDEAPVGITIADGNRRDTPLIYVNEAFEELTGYDEAQVLGRNCNLLQGPTPPTSRSPRWRRPSTPANLSGSNCATTLATARSSGTGSTSHRSRTTPAR